MTIRDIATPVGDSDDLAQQLGPDGIRELLEIMWLAFHDLITNDIDVSGFSENQITEQWSIRLIARWYSENRALRLTCRLDPVLQHEDSIMASNVGQPPTIDFCFRTWAPDDRYFGAECKNLKENNLYLIQRYISTGIGNYISGRYGSSSSVSSLIGYVLSGSIENIISALNREIADTSANLTRDLTHENPHYYSDHVRISDNQKITLHHLMFSFVA